MEVLDTTYERTLRSEKKLKNLHQGLGILLE